MSEDNKQISEETIASIVDAAQNIAEDSTAMRKNLVAIAEALHPTIDQAGIQFYGSIYWSDDNRPIAYDFHLVVDWQMRIVIEESHPDYDTVDRIDFESTDRDNVGQAILHLPEFVNEYGEELKRRHIKYADLHAKADAIRLIVEG